MKYEKGSDFWCGVCNTKMQEVTPGFWQHDGDCPGPVADPVCAESDCSNIVESSENYCTDCLDRMSGG